MEKSDKSGDWTDRGNRICFQWLEEIVPRFGTSRCGGKDQQERTAGFGWEEKGLELKRSMSQKLRMDGRDYSRPGWYFVTLGADYHKMLFGAVRGVEMLPMAMPKQIPVGWTDAFLERRAYWVSAFPEDQTDATRESCQQANDEVEKFCQKTLLDA